MVAIRRVFKSRWWRFPINWWWRSLPLRVVLTVFLASVLVLVLGGFLLMQQATIGVIDGKKEAAKNEARQAVNTAFAAAIGGLHLPARTWPATVGSDLVTPGGSSWSSVWPRRRGSCLRWP